MDVYHALVIWCIFAVQNLKYSTGTLIVIELPNIYSFLTATIYSKVVIF